MMRIMLGKFRNSLIFRALTGFRRKSLIVLKPDLERLKKCNEVWHSGDLHAAIEGYRAYLKDNPYSLEAINNLGICLGDLGHKAEAASLFELGYSLDDTYIPAVINHAKTLIDIKRTDEALPFLKQAASCESENPNLFTVYATLALSRGQTTVSRYFQKKSWAADFDNLRMANGYMFHSCNDDMDEGALASEHVFWAETLRKGSDRPDSLRAIEHQAVESVSAAQTSVEAEPPASRRIRIGYWSPDFRVHSVRYFFRPLLESHDKDRFEIHLYHDGPYTADEQTHRIEAKAEHFHAVGLLNDSDLCRLIKSHQLDILVELAGHTSANRLPLLQQQRFAPLQLTALGYPPTTGVSNIDAKLVDQYVSTPEDAAFYAEYPLVLPSSFWCFDPVEEAPQPAVAPFLQNGFITFGCYGNIAKITKRMLWNWRQILERVPGSRLVVRSISFEDNAVMRVFKEGLLQEGLSEDRIDLRKPEAGARLFESYGEVDLILDTYPFNGGTTTCFAAYMGVPVVSWFGRSLISRMGLSILSNLGHADLAVPDAQSYVDRAVKAATDEGFLQEFRRTARQRFVATSLGNGEMFAREFEQACTSLLQNITAGTHRYHHRVAPLPANEVIKRAYQALRSGNMDAVDRIVAYCFKHHPESGLAHLFQAQSMAEGGNLQEARAYVTDRLHRFSQDEQVSGLINCLRWSLQLQDIPGSQSAARQLEQYPIADLFDQRQIHMYQAYLQAREEGFVVHSPDERERSAQHLVVVVPCDSDADFAVLRAQLSAYELPVGSSVEFQRVGVEDRALAYQGVIADSNADVILIIQPTVSVPENPRFYFQILDALERFDVVGIAGANIWTRTEWRLGDFNAKAAGFLRPMHGTEGLELNCLGGQGDPMVAGMVVLDGCLVAFRRRSIMADAWDKELAQTGCAMEESWTHHLARNGASLGVHRNLGVLLKFDVTMRMDDQSVGNLHLQETLGFDPFITLPADGMILTVPVSTPKEAWATMDCYLKQP